jgi:Family of unknown function (DUF5995)
MGTSITGGSVLAVAMNATGERHDRGDGGGGLDGVLRALRAPAPGGHTGPPCCTWVCSTVVGDVRDRGLHTGAALLGDEEPDPEFEAVLVRRLAHRYLGVVADAAAGRPVPAVWQLLLDPPPVRPVRLAVAGVGTLLGFDLTLAFVGTCTVLGRTPDGRECGTHHRVAALLGSCAREVVRCIGGAADPALAGAVDAPAAWDAAWLRAVRLWALRGRPAKAEAERRLLDLDLRAAALRTLSGTA